MTGATGLIVAVVFAAASTVSDCNAQNTANGNTQEQNALDDLQACISQFPNAEEPWHGPPENALLDNMCLVKCIFERQNTVVNNEIKCDKMEETVRLESARLRAQKIKINETGWNLGSKQCCNVSKYLEVDVPESEPPLTPEELTCVRSHYLWHCDFQMMINNIPQRQLNIMFGRPNNQQQQKQQNQQQRQQQGRQNQQRQNNQQNRKQNNVRGAASYA